MKSRLFAGMIFVVAVGILLLFSPMSINAQGPPSNTTNSQVSSQQEENNNKAIISAFTEAFNDRNYTAIEQYVAECTAMQCIPSTYVKVEL